VGFSKIQRGFPEGLSLATSPVFDRLPRMRIERNVSVFLIACRFDRNVSVFLNNLQLDSHSSSNQACMRGYTKS
jgi:hypothetical protein